MNSFVAIGLPGANRSRIAFAVCINGVHAVMLDFLLISFGPSPVSSMNIDVIHTSLAPTAILTM